MQIIMRDIKALKPYPTNARMHTDSQVDMISESIKQYGWTVPVLIDKNDEIIAGHGRLLAAARLGVTEAPTIQLSDLTEEQVKAYRIADNRMTELAKWDEDLLAAEFAELVDPDLLLEDGFDLPPTGFEDSEISRLIESLNETDDEEEIEAPPSDPITQSGDLFRLGNHRLLCGDATSEADVVRLLDGAKPNLMVTDPPWGVNYDPQWRNPATNSNHELKGKKIEGDMRSDWTDAWSLFPGNVAYVVHGHSMIKLPIHFESAGFDLRGFCIWVKNATVLSRGRYHQQHELVGYFVRKGSTDGWIGDRKQSSVWKIDKHLKIDTSHGNQKPIEVMERPIRNHKGDVYEPFAGSGSTMIAAENQRRRCYMMEIDPSYCDVILSRWRKTGGNVEKC